jgi:hypothetical protein
MEKNANKIRRLIKKKTKKYNKLKKKGDKNIVINNFLVNNNYYTQSINNYS